jgi:hypothetical protein
MSPMSIESLDSATSADSNLLGHSIAAEVITLGFTYRIVRLEASGFHGREPDEHRWNIDSGRIDSWSTRMTVNPGQNWGFQYSMGQLRSPEALIPNEDVRRMMASLMYNRPIQKGNWDSTALWGRNQSLLDGNVGNTYLFESTLHFLTKHYVWTRIENVDRTNELLLRENPLPLGFTERYFTQVLRVHSGLSPRFGTHSPFADRHRWAVDVVRHTRSAQTGLRITPDRYSRFS